MIERYLDPKNVFAFKQAFGEERNKDILIHFLNDVFNHKYVGTIKQVSFLEPNQNPDIKAGKTSTVDVLCHDEREDQYIVEMQVG